LPVLLLLLRRLFVLIPLLLVLCLVFRPFLIVLRFVLAAVGVLAKPNAECDV